MTTFLSSSLLVFIPLVLVGIVLIFRGFRGIPVLCDPKCAKCGYDLRWVTPTENKTCPECGSDLTGKRAVRFGEFRRQPRLMVIGVFVVLITLVSPVLLTLFFRQPRLGASPSGSPIANASTPISTILARLPTTGKQPWDWQELDRRLGAGQLSKADASAAIEALISMLKSKPNGWNEPLHWSGNFVTSADKSGMIPAEQFGRLVEAFYGSKPVITVRPRAREGKAIAFRLDAGGPWNLPNLRQVWALRRVSIDGQARDVYAYGLSPMKPDQLSGAGPHDLDARIQPPVPVGKHRLTFDVDMGVLPQDAPFSTIEGRPGQANRWRKSRHKWSSTFTVPIEIMGPDINPVALVTDAKFDPLANGQLSVRLALYAASENESLLKYEFTTKLPVALACEVKARTATGEIPLGSVALNQSDAGQGSRWHIHPLPPTIRNVDLILTPSAEIAERDTLFEQIWGKEIILKNVPLQREDLDEPQDSAASAPH